MQTYGDFCKEKYKLVENTVTIMVKRDNNQVTNLKVFLITIMFSFAITFEAGKQAFPARCELHEKNEFRYLTKRSTLKKYSANCYSTDFYLESF